MNNDYAMLARLLLNPVQQVNDPYSAMKKGILDLPATEGARPYSGGSNPRVFWRGTNPESDQRIRTGNQSWDSHFFVADNKDAASMYGKQLSQITAKPDAKILYEGTKDFVNVAGRWRKGESLLDYAARAADAAKAAGYDALWFKRQGDVGTAIFNPDKFDFEK